MKLKHNKKRNTAFLYEALVKEITKAVSAASMPLVVIYVKAFSGENHSIRYSEKYKNMVCSFKNG